MKSVPYNSKPTIIEKFETAIAQLFGSKAARFVSARSLRGRRKAALHIDAKRCIHTTYCGPDGLKTFCRADS